MPRRTREAMLRGIRVNRIIAGGYSDTDSGGICPMLAAHRNGGRTDFASFARAWDEYTGEIKARGPRRATKHEVHTLLSYLELSLLGDPAFDGSLRDAVSNVRSERRTAAAREAHSTEQPDIDRLLDPPTEEHPVLAASAREQLNLLDDPPTEEHRVVTDPPTEELEIVKEPLPGLSLRSTAPPRTGDPLVERIVDEVLLRR
jgi:hypothetical protein